MVGGGGKGAGRGRREEAVETKGGIGKCPSHCLSFSTTSLCFPQSLMTLCAENMHPPPLCAPDKLIFLFCELHKLIDNAFCGCNYLPLF